MGSRAVVGNNGARSVQFGILEVDLRAGELRRHGSRVKLQEQPFQILTLLLERPGELVTREELQKKLWPADTFVDFDHSLNAAIRRLRDALGDSAENPRFVETVARRGYRFLADVEAIDSASSQSKSASSVAGDAGRSGAGYLEAAWRRLSHSLDWRLFGFGLGLLAAALFWT